MCECERVRSNWREGEARGRIEFNDSLSDWLYSFPIWINSVTVVNQNRIYIFFFHKWTHACKTFAIFARLTTTQIQFERFFLLKLGLHALVHQNAYTHTQALLLTHSHSTTYRFKSIAFNANFVLTTRHYTHFHFWILNDTCKFVVVVRR